MNYTKISRSRIGRWLGSMLIVTMVLSLLFMHVHVSSAYAETDKRTVYILEAQGDVSVRKSGGSLTLHGYQGMLLSEGDWIATGADSYVVLQVSDDKDEITLGAFGELYISDLSAQDGESLTSLYLQSGSAWVQAHSLTGNEKFEVVTAEGALRVRGTHFLTTFNPGNGQTSMYVAAGVVRASQQNPSDPNSRPSVNVYPAQQIQLDSRTPNPDLRTQVGVVDPEQLVSQSSPRVIESILRNMADIQRENEEMKERLQNSLQNNQEDDANLYLTDQARLEQYRNNIDRLLPNIIKQTVDSGKIGEKQIKQLVDEVNETILDPNAKLNLQLDQVKPLDPSAGLDPEVERMKQQQKRAADVRAQAEIKQLLDNQQRLDELIAKAEQDKKAIMEANRRAAEEAASRAENALLQKLSEAERIAFEERKQRNVQSSRPEPSGSSGPAIPPRVDNPGSPGQPAPGTGEEMAVSLKSAAIDGDTVNAEITMKGFTGENSFFAVEVHLLYDSSKLIYTGDGSVAKNPSSIFGAQDDSLELIREYTSEPQSELYYAALLGITDQEDSRITVDGEQLLVEIPLTLINGAAEDLNIQLIYFKVVDQDGNTVLDGSELLQAPVTFHVR